MMGCEYFFVPPPRPLKVTFPRDALFATFCAPLLIKNECSLVDYNLSFLLYQESIHINKATEYAKKSKICANACIIDLCVLYKL